MWVRIAADAVSSPSSWSPTPSPPLVSTSSSPSTTTDAHALMLHSFHRLLELARVTPVFTGQGRPASGGVLGLVGPSASTSARTADGGGNVSGIDIFNVGVQRGLVFVSC